MSFRFLHKTWSVSNSGDAHVRSEEYVSDEHRNNNFANNEQAFRFRSFSQFCVIVRHAMAVLGATFWESFRWKFDDDKKYIDVQNAFFSHNARLKEKELREKWKGS